jgi:hypothetical protein
MHELGNSPFSETVTDFLFSEAITCELINCPCCRDTPIDPASKNNHAVATQLSKELPSPMIREADPGGLGACPQKILELGSKLP